MLPNAPKIPSCYFVWVSIWLEMFRGVLCIKLLTTCRATVCLNKNNSYQFPVSFNFFFLGQPFSVLFQILVYVIFNFGMLCLFFLLNDQ